MQAVRPLVGGDVEALAVDVELRAADAVGAAADDRAEIQRIGLACRQGVMAEDRLDRSGGGRDRDPTHDRAILEHLHLQSAGPGQRGAAHLAAVRQRAEGGDGWGLRL